MPTAFGRSIWWAFDIDEQGRCTDCVYMDVPAKEPMRHVAEALAAYQTSLELSLEVLAELKEAA